MYFIYSRRISSKPVQLNKKAPVGAFFVSQKPRNVRFHGYPQKSMDWVIVLHGGMKYNYGGMKWELPPPLAFGQSAPPGRGSIRTPPCLSENIATRWTKKTACHFLQNLGRRWEKRLSSREVSIDVSSCIR